MPRTDYTGRVWTKEQKAEFSSYMKHKHRTNKIFTRQALSGLERARAGKRLPWAIGTDKRKVFIKVRNEYPRKFSENQRDFVIKAVSAGNPWNTVLNMLESDIDKD